ncbi:MAG: RsmG family class I SAM-dependent methyltransferase [Oligoflexia bacterium]|nr:RsmG family class I SAM-dependent methyltransferase [Oligoflexia bacterium]
MANAAQWRIRTWFPDLDERACERLRIFQLELIRVHQIISLISANTSEFADRLHFADSILGCRLILPQILKEKEIWDLGSGGGFPGVIMAILRPDLRVLCIDTDEKKTEFIKNTAKRLELDNLTARKSRVEDIEKGSISCAMERGLGSVERNLGFGTEPFSLNCLFFHFKGLEWEKEILIQPKVISTWNISVLGHYNLPTGDETPKYQAPDVKTIVLTKKIK